MLDSSNLFGVYLDLSSQLKRTKHARSRMHRHRAALAQILAIVWCGNPSQHRYLAMTLAPMNLEQATAWLYANADRIERIAS